MLHSTVRPHAGRVTNGMRGHIAGPFAAFRDWPRLCILLSVFYGAVTSGFATAQGNTVNLPHYFGDLNGDGRDDVLLRHADGRWYYYPMNGREFLADQRGAAFLTSNLDWQFAGIGDLNGDGKDDVLVRRVTDGRWYYYPMDGRRHLLDQRGGMSLISDLAWEFAGTGDLNGDGKDDVLLRHRDDGRWLYYPMDGRTHILGGRGLANIPRDMVWQLAGIGDLNGDGNDDVLLRHTNGTWQYFPMNGRDYLRDQRGAAFLTSDLEWQFASIGDLNGDGKDDVLVRRVTSGRWYYYPMDGRRHLVDQRGGANIVSDQNWQTAGIGDLNGDGKDDVLLRHRDDGRWLYYPMDGRDYIAGERGTANLTTNLDWIIPGKGSMDNGMDSGTDGENDGDDTDGGDDGDDTDDTDGEDGDEDVTDTESPDLVIDALYVSDNTLGGGELFTVSVAIRNQGNVASEPTRLRFYRSSDSRISPADTEVRSDPVEEIWISPNYSETWLNAPPGGGTYYYGVCVDSVSGESNTRNNCSKGIRIRVDAPDLAIERSFIRDNTLSAGDIFPFRITVRNRGNISSEPTRLRYYRSSDAEISPGDLEIGADPIAGLSDSALTTKAIRLHAPAESGSYYYGACVDSVQGERNTDNNCSEGVQVWVDAPDLVIRSEQISDNYPGAGGSFTLSVTVRHGGFGPSEATRVLFFRSPDFEISPEDTQVGVMMVDSLDNFASFPVSITLNAPTEAGAYAYGACVVPVRGELRVDNNCSRGVWVEIEVPNLVISMQEVSDTTLMPGEPFTLSATVSNRGRGPSEPTRVRYYRSLDSYIKPDDTEIGQDPVGILSASASSPESIALTAPLEPGTHYYGACVEAVSAENDTGNNCSRGILVSVEAPDLEIPVAEASNNTPAAGESFTLSVTLHNQGTISSGATNLRYYRSSDEHISSNDSEISVEAVDGIDVSAIFNASIALRAPSGSGVYYFGACVDPVDGETITGNNCSGAVRISVEAPDLEVNWEAISERRLFPDRSFSLSARAHNQGMGSSEATRMRFYQSQDSVISSEDIEVGVQMVDSLGISATSVETISLDAPSIPGAYFVACVDPVAGESNPDNNCTNAFWVQVVAPDLVVRLEAVSRSNYLGAGESFILSFTVRNQGSFSSAPTQLRYYRSTDSHISPEDTEIGSERIGGYSNPGNSLESGSFNAPSEAGTYYYGACVDPDNFEVKTENNCSGGIRIWVSAPDLVVVAPEVNADTLSAGESFTLSATVRNEGKGASEATQLRYYRSSDSDISFEDTEVGSSPVGNLNDAAASPASITLRAPSGAGTYYYGACAGSVRGESITANNCSDGVRIWVNAPDLVVVAPEVSDSTLSAGESFTLSATVSNQGAGAGAATRLRYYRSSDPVISPDDTEVGASQVGSLNAAAMSPESIGLTATDISGQYYYGACVDAAGGESNTANNCSDGVRVTVSGITFLEMVMIPGGAYRMGDLSGAGFDNEQPVHEVTVPAFRLGKHEVTFAQWDACVEDGGCGGYVPDDSGWGRGNRPVINVTWTHVQEFIRWLNGKTGGGYRLPTEAEWEYAARAGSTTDFHFGNDVSQLCMYANHADTTITESSLGRNESCSDGVGNQTAEVGQYLPNNHGLHDMHGNVWEWVQDCWIDHYRGAPGDGSVWEAGNCEFAVIRGGGWITGPKYQRSAVRLGTPLSSGGIRRGFRLAHDL